MGGSLPSAYADNAAKSSQAYSGASTGLTVTVLAFLFGAPKWAIIAAATFTVVAASVGWAYADELKGNYSDFKCHNADSFSMFLKNGDEIKTDFDKNGDVSVQRIHDKEAQQIPAEKLRAIRAFAPIAAGACEKGHEGELKSILKRTLGENVINTGSESKTTE